MSDTYASLVLKVDSSQTTTAATNLNTLTTAAKTAAPAVAALTAATAPAGAALNTMSTASKSASSAHAGMSTQAMSAFHSMRSLTESIIAGQSPTTALAMQLNHLSYAASDPQKGLSGAFKEAIGAVTGLIRPAGLAALGAVGVAAGFGIAITKIAASEVAFAALSSRVGTTVQDLHAFESAAAFKGIGSADFTSGIERFGQLTYEASRGMGQLAEYFRLTGTQAGTLEQNFSHAADLIKNAKDDATRYAIIQQLGLPPTAQWVELLKQGSAGIAAAKAEAIALGGAADEALVKRAKDFDESWNRGWHNFETYGKAAIINIADGLSRLNAKLEEGFKPKVDLAGALGVGDIGRAPRNLSADLGVDDIGKKTTPDLNDEKNKISLAQQRVGILGQMVSFEEAARAKKNELNLADLAGVRITKDERDSILETAEAEKLGTLALEAQTDGLKVELAAMNLGVGAAAAYRAEKQKLAELERLGVDVNAKRASQLHDEARALGDMTQKLAEMKLAQDTAFARSQIGNSNQEQQVASAMRQLWQGDWQSHMHDALAEQIRFNSALGETKNLSESTLSGFLKDLESGKGSVVALHNLLGNLESRLTDLATNAAISALFRSLASLGGGGVTAGNDPFGTSGLFGTHHTGGIVGSESGPARNVSMSAFIGAPKFHGGGLVSGEIPIIAKSGEGIFTKNQMANLAPVGTSKPPVQIVNITNNSGAEVKTTKRTGGSGESIVDVVVGIVGRAVSSGALDGPLRARTNTARQPRGR